MNQFDPNPAAWYIVLPLLVLGLATLVWFVAKMRVAVWQRVIISVVSLFAFVGFATALLCVFYHTNDAFNAMFKFYAYTKLAPDADPFTQPPAHDGTIIQMLVRLEGHTQDGKVYVAQPPASFGYDYGAYLFTPGTWQAVKIKDHIMTPQDVDGNGQPDITKTSLWWALRYDPFHLTASAE